MESKEWNVRIFITEEGGDTHARAVLTTSATDTVTGRGEARRNPADRPVPDIGDELAVSRALEDLALKVHEIASRDVAYLAGPAGAR
jgi:hypothetical protein